MAKIKIGLSHAAVEIAKKARMLSFFKSTGICGIPDVAFLKGEMNALWNHKVISQEEKHYLWDLIKDEKGALPDFTVEHWGECIATPGYFPYETFLEELAEKEIKGIEVVSSDGRPADAYSCSPTGISFHKYDYYANHIEYREMKHPLDPHETTMKLISIDEKTDPEWYAADIAVAITGVFANAQRDPAVLAFNCERGDLLAEHVLEGALRAKRFDEEFPVTWNEKEHDYRLMHPGDPFLLDYHWLVIFSNGCEVIVREPLIDPKEM